MPLPDHIRLSDLAQKIAITINHAFANQTYWVIADITDHKFYKEKGHHYFSLTEKDPGSSSIIAKIASVAWSQGAERIRAFERTTGQVFGNDINVLIKVNVSFHQVYGLKTTLIDIDPSFTIGQLEKQRQEILSKLLQTYPEFIRKIGDRYVTFNNELELNPVIQRVAVITSLNSAGFQDFQHTLETNPFGYDFKMDTYYAAVQGIENVRDIYQRFLEVMESGQPYDAVVVIRGGGSQTDFMIFDTFMLGEIVARCPVPVITGIGHQFNETIVDLMAHTPLKTPTKAAEFIIAHNRSFEESMIAYQKGIVIKSQQLITKQYQWVTYFHSSVLNHTRSITGFHKDLLAHFHQVTVSNSKNILFKNGNDLSRISHQLVSKPGLILSNKGKDLANQVDNLKIFHRKYFSNLKGYLGHYSSMVKMMSPENILKKGFAIIYHQGSITTDPAKIKVGSEISVVFSKTELITEVKEKKKRNGKEPNL